MAQGADLNVPRSILSDGSAGADRRTADDRDTIADHEDPDGPADAIVRASGGRIVAETSLYAPVKAFLEAQGFDVKGEVCGCDIVGVRPGEPPLVVVTELKLSFNLELVLQAVDRLSACDAVYLAVVATRRGRDQDRRVHRLCRLLGLGLLAVDLRPGTVHALCHPTPYRPRIDRPRYGRLLREHRMRRGDPTQGGATRQPIMTAYRQRAMACAEAMGGGVVRPRDLRHLAEDAGSILRRNVYGWFERVATGRYRLTTLGRTVLPSVHAAEA